MVARRGSFPRGRFQSPARRQTTWAVGPGGTTNTPISADSAAFVGAGIISLTDGQTIVRLRGQLAISISTATAVLDGFRGAFGIGVVSLPAFTAGIASVPTPLTEQDDDNWLYHQYFSVIAGSSAGETWANSGSASFRTEVDSKAMRKLGIDKVIYSAIEVVETGTSDLDVSFDSRVLVKLP